MDAILTSFITFLDDIESTVFNGIHFTREEMEYLRQDRSFIIDILSRVQSTSDLSDLRHECDDMNEIERSAWLKLCDILNSLITPNHIN